MRTQGGGAHVLTPDAEVRSLSEDELADVRAAEGASVARRSGRPWASIFPGFYQPVNLVARLTSAEVGRPTTACWGYRAAVVAEDAASANGSVPVHLVDGLDHLHMERMAHGRVQDLRKCRARIEFRLIRDPDIFDSAGFAVYASAQQRLHYWENLDDAAYRRQIRKRVADPRRLFVGGFLDSVLGGYLESYIVDGVIFARELIVATDLLRSGISTGLYVETIEMGLRAGAVHAACLGLETPERPGLTRFKDSLGAPVVHLPARSSIPAPVAAYIGARRPNVLYRLVGRRPDAPATPADLGERSVS